jgi:hypothetical protein
LSRLWKKIFEHVELRPDSGRFSGKILIFRRHFANVPGISTPQDFQADKKVFSFLFAEAGLQRSISHFKSSIQAFFGGNQ